jgi:hypothetical protein
MGFIQGALLPLAVQELSPVALGFIIILFFAMFFAMQGLECRVLWTRGGDISFLMYIH